MLGVGATPMLEPIVEGIGMTVTPHEPQSKPGSIKVSKGY